MNKTYIVKATYVKDIILKPQIDKDNTYQNNKLKNSIDSSIKSWMSLLLVNDMNKTVDSIGNKIRYFENILE